MIFLGQSQPDFWGDRAPLIPENGELIEDQMEFQICVWL